MASRFIYVTYIRAPAQKVWDALTDPEQNKLFWGGYHQQSSWEKGADFRIVGPEGDAWDTGEVLVAEPPKRLQVTWTHQKDPAMKAEGVSTVTFELEPKGEVTKLTLTHAMERDGSKLIEAVSTGWPELLSSLKSLLETGRALG
jgi:uncharacterized protein YndB with AHSA1/START domain